MTTENENKSTGTQEQTKKGPSPADFAGFHQRSEATNANVRKTFLAASKTGLDSTIFDNDPVVHSTGEFYTELTPEQKADLEALKEQLLSLLEEDVLEKNSVPVTSAEDVSEKSGIDVNDIRGVFGVLEELQGDTEEGDDITFILIDFEKMAFELNGGGGEGEGEGKGGGSGSTLQGQYVGRVRHNSEGSLLSIAMDAVPPVQNNGAYVLRNDEGNIDDLGEALRSKKSMRETGAYRMIQHNETTGMDGVKRRMIRALTMSYEDFIDHSIDL